MSWEGDDKRAYAMEPRFYGWKDFRPQWGTAIILAGHSQPAERLGFLLKLRYTCNNKNTFTLRYLISSVYTGCLPVFVLLLELCAEGL